MKNKECKITCDKKDMATILHTEDGLNIKLTKEGKEMFKECCGKDCC
jgi:hypothetical protein